MDIIKNETCPICGKKTLTLTEDEKDIPFFGKCDIFSMYCDSCGYHKADIEAQENKGSVKYTLKIEGEDDLNIRVVKSSHAVVNLQHIGSIEPGEAANGYITNVEGIINRIKKQIESLRDQEQDKAIVKKYKAKIKKINRILWGSDSATLSISDPTGNSAIISEKAVKK